MGMIRYVKENVGLKQLVCSIMKKCVRFVFPRVSRFANVTSHYRYQSLHFGCSSGLSGQRDSSPEEDERLDRFGIEAGYGAVRCIRRDWKVRWPYMGLVGELGERGPTPMGPIIWGIIGG